MSDKPRQYTPDEMLVKLLREIKQTRDYWLHESRRPNVEDKMDGLCFSFLSMIDGSSCSFPVVLELVPTCHPGDKGSHQDEGENWYPDQQLDQLEEAGIETIGAGKHMLHELWHYFCEGKVTTDEDGNLVVDRNKDE
jgi:hypothetical protein